jgi:hypothetical protein
LKSCGAEGKQPTVKYFICFFNPISISCIGGVVWELGSQKISSVA